VTTQTFEAGSIREAMFRVRDSLGPDAIILGTREIRRAQANAPLRFAVTATVPPTARAAAPSADDAVTLSASLLEPAPVEPPPPPVPPPPSTRPAAASPPASPPALPHAPSAPSAAQEITRPTRVMPATFLPADTPATETTRPMARLPDEAPLPSAHAGPAGTPRPSTPPPAPAAGPTRTVTRPELLAAPPEPPPLEPPPAVAPPDDAAGPPRGHSPLASMERRLGATLMELRDELARLSRATRRVGPATDEADPDVRGLVAAGVEPTVATAMVARARERVAPGRGLAVAKLPDIEAEIRSILDPAPPLWARHERVVAALVGQTGAGKTRTVAKLAALATFGHNVRVGIITTDTRRIGGLETLEAFCRILGLPLRKARDAQGLAGSIERFDDKDLILVDTPGVGPWDDVGLAELEQSLAVEGCERHLVVPAAAQSHDVRTVARRFAPRELASIIVTKLDEARGPGALLSAAWGGGARLSHLCDGQDVPDACRAIDPHALARGIVARAH
jgi:flagellar biosynthesis protein FlhF